MSAIVAQLRAADPGQDLLGQLGPRAWDVYTYARWQLNEQQGWPPVGDWVNHRAEALSEAIEAAEALGL